MDLNVLFAFYPLFVSYNYGVALLSSIMKKSGCETDVYLLDDIHKFKEYLSKHNFDAVCFSCVTIHDFKLSLPFMFLAVSLGQNVRLGGVYARWAHPVIDGVSVCETDIAEYNSLDDLPLPDYDLFKNIAFDRKYPWLKEGTKILPYHTSRGCPYKCSFCMAPAQGEKYQIRRMIEQDMQNILAEREADVILICDEITPYFDKKWRESWGRFRFPFMCYIRADIEPDQLLWLIDRGMTGCMFGVESGNEKYRNTILKKQLLNRQIYRTVNILNLNNIPFVPFYITGTPDETMSIKKETYDMSKALGGYPMIFKYENIFKEGLTWEYQRQS